MKVSMWLQIFANQNDRIREASYQWPKSHQPISSPETKLALDLYNGNPYTWEDGLDW